MLVFDFDPDPAVEWRALADGARLMRDHLKGLGLETFVKTTGGKGLHVVAPVTPGQDWLSARAFCKGVADAFVAAAPERYTANMSKAKRTDKIFVDYVRNSRGATSVAPYSTRAKQHATLSVPLRWEELSGRVRPDTFTVKNIQGRLTRLRGPAEADDHRCDENGRRSFLSFGPAVGCGHPAASQATIELHASVQPTGEERPDARQPLYQERAR
jgi:bifunctional non-homologous end joining protein LigD